MTSKNDVKSKQHWHGMSVEEAYNASGCSSNYIYLYDNFSPFTHVSNLDNDFVDIVDGGPVLKALPQRDPARNLNLLKGLLLKLVKFFELFLKDRGNPKYQDDIKVRNLDDGKYLTTNSLSALQFKVLTLFGDIDTNDFIE